jgi:hypothetical protein
MIYSNGKHFPLPTDREMIAIKNQIREERSERLWRKFEEIFRKYHPTK